MPLEQIRPALRLDPEQPRRYSSLLVDDDDAVSPAHSPGDDFGRSDWLQGPSGSLRRASSVRKAEEMSLGKLGGVGGVTRSGSWNRGSIGSDAGRGSGDVDVSPGRRGAKLYRSPHPLSEEDGTDVEREDEDTRRSGQTGPDYPGRRKLGSIGGSTSSEAPSSSSRTSTSSSSAAAFSLRSLSNRNSTGSVSSTASSTGSMNVSGSARTQTPESQSTVSPANHFDESGCEPSGSDGLRTDCDSVSDSTEAMTSDLAPPPVPGSAAVAEDIRPPTPPSAERSAQAQATAGLPRSDDHDAAPTSTDEKDAASSRPQRTREEDDSASLPTEAGQTPVARPSMVLRMPSAEALVAGLAQPRSSSADAFATPSEGPPATAEMALRPPAPRRHSGRFMLRSRSQLASHAGLQMSFANGGQGRAAARDRSRHPSDYDNAPFSVLEARRHAHAGDPVPMPSSPRLSATADWSKRKAGASSSTRLAGLTPLARPDLSDGPLGGSGDEGGHADSDDGLNGGLVRPSGLSRSSPDRSLGSSLGSLHVSASSVSGARPSLSRTTSIQGTNVFRTPTMEEWSRFLESQGVTLPSGRHSRTATNFSAVSSQQLSARPGAPGASLGSSSRGDPNSDEDPSSDESDDDLTAGVLEKLRQIGLSRAASRAGSVMGEDLASLHEAEEEDLSSPDHLSTSTSDPLALFMSTPGSRRESPLPSPGLERSPYGSPTYEATPQPSRDRLASLRSPTCRKRNSKEALKSSQATASYSHGEQAQKTISDYVILSEVGRGAYGLVKRARAKGRDGQATGDEVIIKYIIKSRILADCWRRHRTLGPIPIEIHVMDQLRRLPYHPPPEPLPWSPSRPRSAEEYRHRQELGRSGGDPRTARLPRSPSTGRRDLAPAFETAQGPDEQSPPKPMSHPNLCQMLDFFEDGEFYYMVMPRFGTGQDLFDYVESAPDGLDTFEIRSIFGQVADALRFLHANNIVHRDIKDENVILDGHGNVQLIDFGSAAHIRPGRLFDTFSGTLDYAAAEILRGEKYAGQAQDVWALGVVGFVLLCGECPFWNGEEAIEGLVEGSRAKETLRERNVLADADGSGGLGAASGDVDDEAANSSETSLDPATWNVARKKPPHAELDGGGRLDDVVDLISRCLEVDPALRPTAAQICEHRFLAGQGGWTGPRGWLSGTPRSD
ncbi:uncharacterized protein PFL1_04978 [Pseudozyma flocculosa PF-1]|uniref:Protein kinase domain-containing protein n=1 Tax=Pseudozyma flocculosa PF-1 TaxID=1277687 RepID=A0A061H610_9BASI|nr:uncharacterized protein PFL1_04978 [Pseudozyma flocculosa PF-1]EPQ27440.1 hypothetical protein PFL1_04978 [Pseudozyma flocculosa PF-1]